MSDRAQYLKEHTRSWLEAAILSLETQADERTKKTLLESCGRACARLSSAAKDAKAIEDGGKRIDELLDKLSRITSGKFSWQRDGEIVRVVYKKCFCPLRSGGLVKSPTFCNCSTGWLKEIFETALGKPVKVKLEQAIGQGGPVCAFSIRS